MSSHPQLDQLIARFQQSGPVRASSLIVTLYGDVIEPRGGTVWLGSLFSLLEPLGINERLVRTSVFRLAKEDWLTAVKVGRRSYYSLTGASEGCSSVVSQRLSAQRWRRLLSATADRPGRRCHTSP